jgi:hypothetical protein
MSSLMLIILVSTFPFPVLGLMLAADRLRHGTPHHRP